RDERIVILDIDEKSLGEVGRWPWSRNVMAELTTKLFERYGVALVGFDVVLAERDPSSGIEVLDALSKKDLQGSRSFQETYSRLRPSLDFDARFAQSLKDRPVVLGYYFNSEERAVRVNALPEPVMPRGAFDGKNVAFLRWVGYTGNLPLYQRSAVGAGHFNPEPDFDGVLRRVPMLAEFDGAYYESLSLAMVRAYLRLTSGQAPAVSAGYPPERPNDLEWLDVGGVTFPVDESASALVPYRGGKGSFPYHSLADVLNDRIEAKDLQGKIALIGTSAPGLQDLRATPVQGSFPGVEIHANLIAGILDRELKHRPWYTAGAETFFLLVGGLALSILIPRLSALWATLATALGIAMMVGLNAGAWHGGLVLPLASSLLIAAAIYTMNMAYGYFVESRSKRRLAGRFREYVPPEVVAKMELDPEAYDKPKTAELTILFADIRGFTGISEALSPEELRDYINEYLSEMSAIIRDRHRGTLDKYIGDAIMAFWGAPVDDAQHARNAVLAALDMQRHCGALNARLGARGWPRLAIGIGVNSGTVRVGNMGSRVRRAYTAMGDAVNVASRLESRTKNYAVGILVGEATRARVEDVVFREIDRIQVKGKDEAVTVYEPLGENQDFSQWQAALRAYRAQDWSAAEEVLLNLKRQDPSCGLYEAYLKKIQDWRSRPPPAGWDGVTVFDEK
ncbi:MAG TPA: adenylate/guanylate cyclase domain-containing protein, partial [Burkholderiales bacterium]